MQTLSPKLTLFAVLLSGTAAFAQEDHTVRIVLNEELDVVEPCMAARSDVGRVILQNVNETLTEFVPGQTELKPRLATEWTQVDDDTWRIKLRDGVTFHDGSTLDAADVAFTLDRIKVPKFGCEVGVKYFGDIAVRDRGRRRPDDRRHHHPRLADPAAPALDRADRPFRDPGRQVRGEAGRHRSVPLRRVEPRPGHRAEAQPGLLGRAPQVEEATYLFRSDPAVAAAMVEAGEADIVPNLSMDQATNPDTDFSYPNSETTTLRIDTTMAPTNDRRIREAMNLAIDREAFRGSLLPGRRAAGDADGRADDDRLQPRPQGLALRSRARQGADRRGEGRRRARRHPDRDHRPHRHPSQRHRGDGGDDGRC